MSGGRGAHADLLTQLRGEQPKPVILLEIATGDVGTPYIRICNLDRDITFPSSGGNIFTARPFDIEAVTISGTEFEGVDVTMPDVDLEFDTWFQSTDFKWQKMSRYMVDRDSLDGATKAYRDTFRFVSRRRGHLVTIMHFEPLGAILQRIEVPKRTLSREEYPAIPDEGIVQ